jgi:hypothetical protein
MLLDEASKGTANIVMAAVLAKVKQQFTMLLARPYYSNYVKC